MFQKKTQKIFIDFKLVKDLPNEILFIDDDKQNLEAAGQPG